MDEIYINKLIKDIEKVEKFIQQADNAIEFLLPVENSAPLDRKIFALYQSYCKLPYNPEKSDSITTAATNVILTKMVNEMKQELEKEEPKKQEKFDDIIELLKQDQLEKSKLIKEFSFEFKPDDKSSETRELQSELTRDVKKIIAKFIKYSNLNLNEKDFKEILHDAMQFTNQLCRNIEWLEPPANLRFFTETLVKNNVLYYKDGQVKLIVR
ncbi:unnamed protein product [Candida verbasci]|uniref:Uncharacterized protein n=1 Tax=Candida verbasci TaxID=1227364 RepID=A0A9W4TXE2_9ASCO|nr:unnamed protein product [Candida verbasci]